MGVYWKAYPITFNKAILKVGQIEHKNLGVREVEVKNRSLKILSKPFVQCCFTESFLKV